MVAHSVGDQDIVFPDEDYARHPRAQRDHKGLMQNNRSTCRTDASLVMAGAGRPSTPLSRSASQGVEWWACAHHDAEGPVRRLRWIGYFGSGPNRVVPSA